MTFNMKPTREKGDTNIGPDHKGRHPHHPGRDDLVKTLAHHVPAIARGMEAQQHDHATLGKPGVAKGYPVLTHPGMSHVADGAFNAGISRTESGAALQGYKLPTDPPKEGKTVRRAEINPGSRSRNSDSLASESAGVAHARATKKGNEELHDLGRLILNEARIGAGEHSSGLKIGALPPSVVEET